MYHGQSRARSTSSTWRRRDRNALPAAANRMRQMSERIFARRTRSVAANVSTHPSNADASLCAVQRVTHELERLATMREVRHGVAPRAERLVRARSRDAHREEHRVIARRQSVQRVCGPLRERGVHIAPTPSQERRVRLGARHPRRPRGFAPTSEGARRVAETPPEGVREISPRVGAPTRAPLSAVHAAKL